MLALWSGHHRDKWTCCRLRTMSASIVHHLENPSRSRVGFIQIHVSFFVKYVRTTRPCLFWVLTAIELRNFQKKTKNAHRFSSILFILETCDRELMRILIDSHQFYVGIYLCRCSNSIRIETYISLRSSLSFSHKFNA